MPKENLNFGLMQEYSLSDFPIYYNTKFNAT